MKSDLAGFLDISQKISNTSAKSLTIDLKEATRIWPSAIALLASLARWMELTARNDSKPKIQSSTPEDLATSAYLNHSGLYDYVGRGYDSGIYHPIDTKLVRIRREDQKSKLVERIEELEDFVQNNSSLDSKSFELFRDSVLTEIFLNITEHGIPVTGEGWWFCAENCEDISGVSISLADNGIGIANSLRTGILAPMVRKRLGERLYSDDDCIRLALEEKISGAFNAVPPESNWFGNYVPKGRSRGNGLDRLFSACKKLKVQLTILSHCGYVILSENGSVDFGKRNERVFCGTLYHLFIPDHEVKRML